MSFFLRLAVDEDTAALRELIELSVRKLQAGDYSSAQLESALEHVYGVDSRLIADGTYFVVEASEVGRAKPVIGCGGWSKRKTLYGGDHWIDREDSLLDPVHDAARIRAFFVHPDWARRGIGSMILRACEEAASAAGFTRLEMGSTLTGVKLYEAKGYVALENLRVAMPDGNDLPIVRMAKRINNTKFG